MAKKILRFKIERDESGHLPSEVALDIPMGSRILRARAGNSLSIWAIADDTATPMPVKAYLVPTGAEVPPEVEKAEYIGVLDYATGTAQTAHLFLALPPGISGEVPAGFPSKSVAKRVAIMKAGEKPEKASKAKPKAPAKGKKR